MLAQQLVAVTPCFCRGVPLLAPRPRLRQHQHRPSPRCAAQAEGAKSRAPAQTQRVAWSTRNVLRSKGVKPKRSLGQNFLQREEVLSAIVDAAQLSSGERALEIGPGTGNLTKYMLQTGAKVTAVEKDDVLYKGLLETFKQELESGQLRLVHSDVLALSTEDLLGAAHDCADPNTEPPLKVVANLPYNITKLVMRKLLPLGDHFSDLFLMLQDEVAHRLVAGPGSGAEYRAMNLEVAFYSDPTYLFQVDRTAYIPEPNVDGAVVRFRLKQRSAYPLQDDLEFHKMVRQAFTERRKMLRNTLHCIFEPALVSSALEATGLDAKIRPQELDLQQYVRLWQQLLTQQ